MNKAYRIEGDFQMGRIRQHFVLEAVGSDEQHATQHALAELGSRHGVKRRQVDISNVTELNTDDASPITQQRLKGSK